jgi:hypothetical protein
LASATPVVPVIIFGWLTNQEKVAKVDRAYRA